MTYRAPGLLPEPKMGGKRKLDPESSLLPEEIRYNWESSKKIYALSRDYVYNLHTNFDKFYEKKS